MHVDQYVGAVCAYIQPLTFHIAINLAYTLYTSGDAIFFDIVPFCKFSLRQHLQPF